MFHRTAEPHTRSRLLPLLLVLWIAALIPAARGLLNYEWTAGAMQTAPSWWPVARLTAGNSTGREGLLIVAVHPLCSCTRATLEELENSAATWRQPYHATILFYQPKDERVANAAFTQAAYVSQAKQVLHAELIADYGGEQAARLGALTSGEVLYYSAGDAKGQRRLLFSGGVTAGRGMVGENGGIEALERAVKYTNSPAAEPGQQAHPPVYGCGLASLSAPKSGGPSR